MSVPMIIFNPILFRGLEKFLIDRFFKIEFLFLIPFIFLLIILYDQCLATLMRALSTCDKQNLCNGGGEPQEKKKTFESMNSALYVHIDSELKYLLVHEF